MELISNRYFISTILCMPILLSLFGYMYTYDFSYTTYYFNDAFALYQLPAFYLEILALTLLWTSLVGLVALLRLIVNRL